MFYRFNRQRDMNYSNAIKNIKSYNQKLREPNMQNNKDKFKDRFSKYVLSKIELEKTEKAEEKQEFIQSKKRPASSAFPFSELEKDGQPYKRLKRLSEAPQEEKESSFRLEDYALENYKAHDDAQKRAQKKRLKQLRQLEQVEREKRILLDEQSPVQRKRLKKLRQLQQNECGICLDQIKKRCHMQCKHQFCFECLQSWFQTSNKCPYCRAQATSYWYKGEQYLLQPVERDSHEYSDLEESQPMIDYPCYKCDQTQEGDTVVICDQCSLNACHIECDDRLMGRVPRGDWLCHFCS